MSGSDSTQQSNVRIYASELPLDSINSLTRQMILGTRNLLKNVVKEGFSITPTEATFYPSAIDTDSSYTMTAASLDDIETLWQDYRVAGAKNYKFLPRVIL